MSSPPRKRGSIVGPARDGFPLSREPRDSRETASNCSSHKHVRTELSAAERSDDLKPLLLKHRRSSVRGLIPESVGFPLSDRVRFEQSTPLALYGLESGFQRSACYAAFAVVLQNDKAGNSPKFLRIFKAKASVLATVADARKLFTRAVLAPAYRFSLRVDEDSVGAPLLHQVALFPPVPFPALCSRAQPFVLGQPVRAVKMHAPAMIPAVVLREESLKIGPSLLGQLLRRVSHMSQVTGVERHSLESSGGGWTGPLTRPAPAGASA
jgi:hypothetical protein